jgi:WD40 repeat protein
VLGKQTGAVIDVSPSPDGRSVLSAGDAGIWRWDLVSGRGRRIVAGDFIHAMFTPQPDSYIATVGGQSEPSVIRIVDGRTDPIAASGVQVAGLSGDGKLLGLGTENGLEVWSFGKQAARIYTRPIKAGVNDVAFDAEGDLATANGDGSVSVYAARTGVLRTRLLGHDGPVPSVTFAPGGRLVSAGNDGSARSWAWSDGRPVTIDAGGLPDRGGLHYDASGQLITVNPLGAARIWNVAGTGRSGLPAVGAGATSAAVSTDGRLVVTGAEDGTLVARNRDGRVAGRWKVPGYPLVIALDRTNTRIAVALLEGPVVEARIGETKVRTVTEGTSPAFTVGFSPDGTLIASGTQDGAVMVARGTAPGVELASHDGPVFATEFSPDGRRLATASGDKTVSIWDPATGQLLQTLRGHNGNVEGVAWVDDDRLVSAGADAVRVWDWQRGVTLLTLPRPDGATQVAVTGDGPTIADYGIDTPVSVSNCDVCGSIDSVIALASQRTTRELTAAERRDFQVSGSP